LPSLEGSGSSVDCRHPVRGNPGVLYCALLHCTLVLVVFSGTGCARQKGEDAMKMKVHAVSMAVLLTMAVTTAAAKGSDEYWPGEHWRTSTPEAQGFSSAELVKAFDFISEKQINIHSLLVVRHGYLVLEAYFHPCGSQDLHDICSCTKSISSTLVGIAIEKGKIRSVREPLADLFPGRRIRDDEPRKKRITLEHILSMSSGMNYPLLKEPRLAPMREAPDMVQFILDLPMVAEPGTVFGYNSGGSHLLSALITLRTGQTAEEFARQNLFGPLGIRDILWPADSQGISHGWGDLKLLSPDMARIGYLVLKKGRWEGKQIVSSRWVKDATRRHLDVPDGAGYGYQWWVRDDPPRFEALGRAGQRITVLPSLDTIVVFTGGGFEPADVGAFIGAALRSDRPLPEDPAAYAKLQASIAAAASPPPAQPVPELPAIALAISGKQYTLDRNGLGLLSIRFTFPGADTALLELRLEDRVESHPVGLDGVYRVSRQSPDAKPVAVKGAWLGEREFGFMYNEFTTAQNTTGRVVFQGDGISLKVSDPDNDLDLTIAGHAAE
jgi:CubicO group peptidase (beta-lactamase class C family)